MGKAKKKQIQKGRSETLKKIDLVPKAPAKRRFSLHISFEVNDTPSVHNTVTKLVDDGMIFLLQGELKDLLAKHFAFQPQDEAVVVGSGLRELPPEGVR